MIPAHVIDLDWLHERIAVDTNGCWIWTLSVRRDGYGQVQVRDYRAWAAHRLSYLLHFGFLPAGLHIDHLCSVRRCVNPDHLEAVTQAENNRRSHERRLACPQGHPKTPEHVRVRKNGKRECRTCHNERRRLAV